MLTLHASATGLYAAANTFLSRSSNASASAVNANRRSLCCCPLRHSLSACRRNCCSRSRPAAALAVPPALSPLSTCADSCRAFHQSLLPFWRYYRHPPSNFCVSSAVPLPDYSRSSTFPLFPIAPQRLLARRPSLRSADPLPPGPGAALID